MSESANPVPSAKLLKLVDDWNEEVRRFRMIAKVFQVHVGNLGDLNSLIWHQCKDEGVDIDSLPMVRNEKSDDQKTKDKGLARKPRKKRAKPNNEQETPSAIHSDNEGEASNTQE